MTRPDLHITDHAIIRYCERALGLDRKAIEDQIRAGVGDGKNGRFQLPGTDMAARVINRTVVSVVPVVDTRVKEPKKKRKKHAPVAVQEWKLIHRDPDWRDTITDVDLLRAL